MFEVQMLVPVTHNDGKVVPSEVVLAFESSILDSFGGFSLLPTELTGEWRSNSGVRYRDRSRCYLIAVPSIGRGGDIVALAELAKSTFSQEAIAIRYLGLLEIL